MFTKIDFTGGAVAAACRLLVAALIGTVTGGAVVCGSAAAVEPGLGAELSYEHLKLPKTQFTFVYDNSGAFGNVPFDLVSKDTNHNGSLDGARLDLSWGTRTTLFGGVPIVAGIKGYYARHSSSQTSTCSSTSDARSCAHAPLFDPDPNALQLAVYAPPVNPGDPPVNIVTRTHRDTTTWGLALEGQSVDARVLAGTIATKAGLGYRRIDAGTSLNGSRVSGGLGTPVPFSLSEDNGTGYLGGYVGAVAKLPLGDGYVLALDGEAGLYWAHTSYKGRYSQSDEPFLTSVDLAQTLTLGRDTAAVIAALKVGVDKDFGAFKAGVFARGEFYSYAPEMRYNNVDRYDLALPPTGGANDGTSIARGVAWTASLGARVTVPFGQ